MNKFVSKWPEEIACPNKTGPTRYEKYRWGDFDLLHDGFKKLSGWPSSGNSVGESVVSYTKVAGPISDQGTHKKQPINA